MNILHIDLETYSPVPLTTSGVYRYAEEVEIMLFAYALNDGEVKVWDWTHTKQAPLDLVKALKVATHLAGQNVNFEKTVFKAVSKRYPEWSLLNMINEGPYDWVDTMVIALSHGLPGNLGTLSEIYKLPQDKAKDKAGKALINFFCKPKKDGTRNTSKEFPKKWAEFIAYNILDVEAERELTKKLPKWNSTDFEYNLWLLDQKINDRGFAVDTELADAALQAVGEEKVILDARTSELTEGDVSAATKRDALLKHILEVYGVTLPDMQISTLERRLNDPELPEAVKELIGLRLIAAGTATTKYKTLLRCVCQDNRLRGTLQFCGANRTGRWAGRIFQPQNLPRPTMKNKEIDFGIRTLKAGAADLFYDNVKDLASNAIRGCIVAPEGKQLVVSDLSSIEGRVLAWLAGERWKIDAYYDYDMGQGYDMYVWAYANTFGVDPATVGKAERTLGKPIELALGYGGGVGAFITFANVYGIDLDSLVGLPIDKRIELEARSFWIWAVKNKKTHGLSEETFVVCDSIKRMWREKNAMIESFWKTLEHDVKSVLSGGFAEQRKFYKVDKKGSWLRIQLPSGRFLSYPGAKLDEENKISYLGVNQYSRKWGRLYTYGGKLAENVTQAAARDVLAVGMVNAEAARYEIILDVHDELLTETPDRPEFNHNHLSELMSKNPEWAKGLPLAAAGFESYRYRKD